MQKKIILSLAVLAIVTTLHALSLLSEGDISLQLKAMHILSDKTNKFAPEEGSGYLGKVKYVSPKVLDGLKVGAGVYINGNTGFTDFNNNKNDAIGMFTDIKGKDKVLLGEVYLEYKSNKLHAKAGRQILNTPLTTISWSLMPNFYEAAILESDIAKNFLLKLVHITRMSYGSRSATDFGLIGEKTATAGLARPTLQQSTTGIKQATFLDVGQAAVGTHTKGITAVNVTYNGVKNLTLSLWDYYAYDIANMIYTDANYKIAIKKDINLFLSAQYLSQNELGDNLAGNLNYNMWGAKAKVANKQWSAYIGYNKSNDEDIGGKFINPWGGDPAYTSSLFSRNVYRQDVSAYKIGGDYSIIKGLKLIVSYAHYSKSKTIGWGTLRGVKDATETDIILAYKPTKQWMFKIFNTTRTSEYDGVATGVNVEKKMNHVRVVASYSFVN